MASSHPSIFQVILTVAQRTQASQGQAADVDSPDTWRPLVVSRAPQFSPVSGAQMGAAEEADLRQMDGRKTTGATKACTVHLHETSVTRHRVLGTTASTASQQNKGLGDKGQDRGLGLKPPEIAKTGWHRLMEAKVFQQGLLHRVLGAYCGLRTV